MLRVEEIERLSRYQAGELTSDEARELELEVARRPELSAALTSLKRLDELAAELEVAPSPGSDPAIARAIRESGRRPLPISWAVALVACAAVATTWLALQAHPPGPSTPAVAEGNPRAAAQAPIELRLPQGEVLFLAGSRYSETGADIALEQGTAVVKGSGLSIVRGADRLEVNGEAVVSTEPLEGLAHVTDALKSNPRRSEMLTRLTTFEGMLRSGRARCVVGALLSYCALDGSVAVGKAAALPQSHSATSAPADPAKPASLNEDLIRVEVGSPHASPIKGDPAAVNASLKAASADLVRCFEVSTASADRATGQFTVALSLNPDGTASQGSLGEEYTGQNPLIAACVLSVLSRLSYPGSGSSLSLSFGAALDGEGRDRRLVVHLPEALRDQPSAVVGPPDRVADLDLRNAPSMGPSDAPITLVEVTDFACGFCAQAHKTVGRLLEAYPGKIRLVELQNPLPSHPQARAAAAAALAADEQGKYWPYAELLFQNTSSLDRASLDRFAKGLGLDIVRFDAALDSGRFESTIDAQMHEAARWEITGDPAFTINGHVLVGALPFEIFKSAIDSQLAKLAGAVQAPAPAGEPLTRPKAPDRLDGVEVTYLSNGTRVTMASLRKRVMVLSFWSSMDPDLSPQKKLQQVADSFSGDPDVRFLIVNIDGSQVGGADTAALKELMAKSGLKIPVVLESPQIIAYVNESEERPSGMPENQVFMPNFVVLRDLNEVRLAGSLKMGSELPAAELQKIRKKILDAKK